MSTKAVTLCGGAVISRLKRKGRRMVIKNEKYVLNYVQSPEICFFFCFPAWSRNIQVQPISHELQLRFTKLFTNTSLVDAVMRICFVSGILTYLIV